MISINTIHLWITTLCAFTTFALSLLIWLVEQRMMSNEKLLTDFMNATVDRVEEIQGKIVSMERMAQFERRRIDDEMHELRRCLNDLQSKK